MFLGALGIAYPILGNVWVDFIVAAMLIIFAGTKITKYGDIISEKFNLGHAFIGAVLIGWSTSLPELILSIGTSVVEGKPNITMGNVLGSNLFNLFILVLLDFYYLKGAILRQATGSVKTSALLSLIIILAVGLFLCLPLGAVTVGSSSIGYSAIVVFGIYMLSMLILYMEDKSSAEQEKKYKDVSMPITAVKCLVVVAVIISAGLWLSGLSSIIAKDFGEGFAGAFFLAVVSSLPEVITCVAAVRLGFHSMAIGTLFGSNIFNMGIVAFCDIFYTGKIFSDVNEAVHLSSVAIVVIMTVVTIIFLRKPEREKKSMFGTESIALALLYAGALYLSYHEKNFLTPMWENLAKLFGG